MSTLDIFKGNSLVGSDLFKSLMETNKKLAGGSGATGRRISIRGSRFRMVIDGEQVSVSPNSALNMVVVDAAPIARTYYEGTYDAENPSAPTCWSADTRMPSDDVPEDNRQSARCTDCPMNIKGSGQGESRACRFSQRIAVMLEGEPEEVYQLQLPATSIFGEAKAKDMGMQAYIKFLTAHNTPSIAVMTEMRFDDDATAPKLYFRATRALDEEELKAALTLRESDETKKAIEFTVGAPSGNDKIEIVDKDETAKTEKPKAEKPKAEKPKAEKPKAETKQLEMDLNDGPIDEADDGDDAPVEEPKKAAKAEKPKPQNSATAEALAAIAADWDD